MSLLAVLLLAIGSASFSASPPGKLPQPNWAFRPVTRPPVPTPKNAAWSTNVIDRFLLAKLEERGLSPAPPAEPRALARRLHFILTGLPPSTEQSDAFVRELSLAHSPTSPLASRAGAKVGKRESEMSVITRAVDSLLGSTHFGERFARHWQDVVRYADTHGTEHDAFLPHAWRYRDWLIRAFNNDLPYDQFVREHIAGDLLEKPRWADGLNQSLLASAWWRLVEFNQTPVDVKGEEVIVVDSQIDAMSKAFLGLTVSCARCHDHKFDPISQRDFHGLYSILASSRTSMRVLDAPEKLHAHDAELAKIKTEIRSALAATWKLQIEQWPTAFASLAPTGGEGRGEGANATFAVELTRWRTAFAAAETNKSPLAPVLKALRSGAAVPAAGSVGQPSRLPELAPTGTVGGRVAAGTATPLPSFADFTTGLDRGWFATGGFARHSRAGDFSLATSGSNILAAIYPSGRFSHLLSDKHAGTLRSPNLTLTNKFVAALVTGDNNARVRLVIENFQGDSLLFTQITPKLTDRSALRWVTLPVRDTWRGRRAYIELTPRDDFPYLGIVRDASKLPTDGRSAAGIAKVILHDGEKPPEPPAWPGELAAALTGSGGKSGRASAQVATLPHPVPLPLGEGTATPPRPGTERVGSNPSRPASRSLPAGEGQGEGERPLSTAFVRTTQRAIEAWAAGRCDDAQANFLNSLLRLGLLENTVTSSPSPPAGERAGVRGQSPPSPRGAPTTSVAPPPHPQSLSPSGGEGGSPAALLTRFREVEARVPIPTRVVAVSDEAPPFETPFFPRGDHAKPGDPVPRQFLAAFGATPYRSAQSGRRELAEDILRNPLTARVMVNRLWQHVFGTGLVASPDNFGQLAEAPSHPELLDWLASEFVAQGWSVKAMLRLMLTSRAFAMSSDSGAAVPAAGAVGQPSRLPEPNVLLGQRQPGRLADSVAGGTPAPLPTTAPPPATAPLRRLDAESIRDAILAASGRLDRTPFGPGVPVTVPPSQRDDYTPADGPVDGRGRRSLYLEVRRNHPAPFLFAFDQPKPAAPAGRREPTNVPAQSLTLLNDPFVREQAGHFATRALAQPGDASARIRWLYATALSRPATNAEVTRAAAFLTQQTTTHGGDPKAWQDLAHAVFNLKEFIYLK